MTIAIDYLAPASGPTLGLSVAIDDFTRAWVRHSSQRPIVAHTSGPADAQAFLQLAQNEGADIARECAVLMGAQGQTSLAPLSCLFVPDPALGDLAWKRALLDPAARPVLCGLVHTLTGDKVARALWDTMLAPSARADALICPSRAIESAVQAMAASQSEIIARHRGLDIKNQIQTHVLPLGIDVRRFEALSTPALRTSQRAALGAMDDEILILFVGRLNFATKAHPLPLLLALRRAAAQTSKKLRLILYGYYYPSDMQPRFEKLLAEMAPDVNCEIVLNSDPRFPQGLWAAADLFTSLVDNVQESFGLTPIEAMACGLPCVVTDWDGYREGVRHGKEGFLIPTFMPPASAGADVAALYAFDGHYGNYLMGASQSCAIAIDAAAQAFVDLAENETLRRTMGESGRQRALSLFDWQFLIPQYEAFLTHLAGIGRGLLARQPQLPTTPFHANLCDIFASFPTATLAPTDRIEACATAADLRALTQHDMNLFVPSLLLPLPLIEQILENAAAPGGLDLAALLNLTPPSETARLWRTIGWLVKHGLCRRRVLS